MAFMGRGGSPTRGNNRQTSNNSFRRYGYYDRFYYYIPLDNTYVIMQMIATFAIIIIGIVVFLTAYKSTIIDPIESTKRIFINIHLLLITVLLVITLIINFLSKTEAVLVKRLAMTCAISLIIMIVFFGIKINLDTTYTKEKFEQFYAEQNIDQSSNTKTKIGIGLAGMSIKTEKQYYIDECMKLYNIFKVKAWGTLGIHLLLNILLIFQITRISKIQGKKEKIDKDDLILFDEEQNVRY